VAHEEVGFVWVEVKGHTASGVELEGSELVVRYAKGRPKHACQQVINRMFAVIDFVKPTKRKAAMNWVLAFPNSTTAAWEERGLLSSFNRVHLLLKDDLDDPVRCLARLRELASGNGGKVFDAVISQEIRKYYGCSQVIRDEAMSRPG